MQWGGGGGGPFPHNFSSLFVYFYQVPSKISSSQESDRSMHASRTPSWLAGWGVGGGGGGSNTFYRVDNYVTITKYSQYSE